MAGTCSATWGGMDDVHIPAPTSKAVNKSVELLPKKSSHKECLGATQDL